MPSRPPSPARFSEGDRVSVRLPGTVTGVVTHDRAGVVRGPRYTVALDRTPADVLAGRPAHTVECSQSQLRAAPSAGSAS